jgi:hypothetical protein
MRPPVADPPSTGTARGTSLTLASAASRDTSGSTVVYKSAVIDKELCRSICDVVFMSFPAANDNVAAPWRRSCYRIGGRPAANVNRSKCSLTQSGFNSAPFSFVKMRPVSTHTGVGEEAADHGVGICTHLTPVRTSGRRRYGMLGIV